MNNGIDVSFLAAYGLILLALAWSARERLGMTRTIFVNSLVALVQLFALGWVLVFILKFESWWQIGSVWIVMLLFAAWTSWRRVRLEGGFVIALASISLASLFVVGLLGAMGIIGSEARELVPLFGMIVGNSLNIYTMFVDRLRGEITNTLPVIEGMVALGAGLKEALHDASRHATKAAMIPVINNLQTVGIIHIPGVTVGMLLAGAQPVRAVSMQLVIMYMMVAVALTTAVLTSLFASRAIFANAADVARHN